MAVKTREFVYTGGPVPDLDGPEYAAFLLNLQKGILLSLEQRNLLTASQRERCLAMLKDPCIQKAKATSAGPAGKGGSA